MAEGLGEELVVAAVGPVDEVVAAQAEDRPDRAALLADARVGGPVHQSVGRELQDLLLEHPDPQGLAEHLKDELGFAASQSDWSTPTSTHGDAGGQVSCA